MDPKVFLFSGRGRGEFLDYRGVMISPAGKLVIGNETIHTSKPLGSVGVYTTSVNRRHLLVTNPRLASSPLRESVGSRHPKSKSANEWV